MMASYADRLGLDSRAVAHVRRSGFFRSVTRQPGPRPAVAPQPLLIDENNPQGERHVGTMLQIARSVRESINRN
jgi:hypothetical protein